MQFHRIEALVTFRDGHSESIIINAPLKGFRHTVRQHYYGSPSGPAKFAPAFNPNHPVQEYVTRLPALPASETIKRIDLVSNWPTHRQS